MRKQRGITLIALVITIIVLLILAGISIATLTGENGILGKANTAKEEHKIAQYKEELNLIITEEVTERKTEVKKEPMIESLDKKIAKKEWVAKTSRENKEGASEEYLIVESKEGYEFIIEVNNEKETANIIKDSKTPGEKYTITYDPNGGVGDPKTVEVRSGFYKIVEKNTYTREDYIFAGWCENPEPDGEAIIYSEGSKYTAKRNVTLYAIWNLNVATITFDANTGTGNMTPKKVTIEQDTKLPVNTFSKKDYDFVKWNTKADGTGTDYEDSAIINITKDITLYAMWKISAKSALKIDATATTAEGKSPYVRYNNLNCRVLYNDATNGIQIITAESVAQVALGEQDEYVTASDFSYSGRVKITDNFRKAAASYNNAVDNLNKRAKTYMDTKGIATDARCLGSIPKLTSDSKFTADTSGTYNSGGSLTYYGWDDKFKNEDTNYSKDLNQLNTLELHVKGNIWFASRYIYKGNGPYYFQVRGVSYKGAISSDNTFEHLACGVTTSGGSNSNSYTNGFRPVFLLPSDVVISDGNGSSGNPYILDK